MKEKDYIYVSDITNIRRAKDALRNITPDNNPIIEKDRFITIYSTLTEWEEKISKRF